MTQPRGVLLTASLLVTFIGAMAVTGRMRESQRLVRFEPAGLVHEAPEQITRVELTAGGRHTVFVRAESGGWATEPAPRPLSDRTVSHLETSLRFMHAAAPVRVMRPGEYERARLNEYGLDPPRYTVALYRGSSRVVATSFGATNATTILQYAQIEGRPELYLLPGFVGREWDATLDAAAGR